MSFASALSEPIRSLRSIQVLAQAQERGRLAHAILLHGPQLELLETVALALARSLLKTDRNPATHPDYFVLRPAKRSRQISVGDRKNPEENTMRWLIKSMHQTSHQGGDKVAVIYEADRMNDSTANAFLKTLEEPPAGTTLLLLTTRPYDLLPTIQSRCLGFRLIAGGRSTAADEWLQWLQRYRSWLGNVWQGATSPSEKADLVLAAYGLIGGFFMILDAQSETLWKEELANVPDGIDADEKDALKVALSKGLRSRLLTHVEEETRAFAQEDLADTWRLQALSGVIAEFERMVGLMEVNLKADVAIEWFFLASMRRWSMARNISRAT